MGETESGELSIRCDGSVSSFDENWSEIGEPGTTVFTAEGGPYVLISSFLYSYQAFTIAGSMKKMMAFRATLQACIRDPEKRKIVKFLSPSAKRDVPRNGSELGKDGNGEVCC